MHTYIRGLRSCYVKKKRTEDFEIKMDTRAINFHIYLYLENLDQLTREIKDVIIYSYLSLYCKRTCINMTESC